MRYFIHLNGQLREVQPLTRPHRTQSTVIVRRSDTGRVLRVEHNEIIRHEGKVTQ